MNLRLNIQYKLEKLVEIKSISSIYIFHFDKSYTTDFERHCQPELIYVDEGVEQVWEDDKVYTVKKGEMFLHKPWASHKDACLSDESRVYIISFTVSSKCLESLFDRVIQLKKNEINQLKQVFETYVQNVDSEIDQWFSDKKIIADRNSFGVSQIIKNNFELFFLSLLNPEDSEKLEYRKYDNPLINRVIEELDKEKYEKFSLDRVGKNLSYSKSYLCRQFKRVTGVTIIYYFYSLKVEEAKKMLMHDGHSIEETSVILNFDSVQYFSKVFKKYCGLSPSDWRTVSSKRMYF